LGVIKISQFIKPQIIWIYDGVQKAMIGAYSFNPLKEAKYLARGTRDVLNQTDKYHQLNELNLYQFPYETPRAAQDEMVNMAIRKTQADIPNWEKKLESITNMTWEKEEVNPLDVLMSPYRAMANATWLGDKIIRTSSVYALEDMGYPIEEAVRIASRGHGAYSELSLPFKRAMSPIVFVHSFRILMPMEMAKVVSEPIKGVIDAKTKGKKIPPHQKERWVKSIIGSLIMPVAIDLYMKARGFKRDKFAWKWRKEITDKMGRKKEIVVGVNYIINMPIKWWHRLTAHNPVMPTARPLQGIKNTLQWEVHPMWRILFWDLNKNKRSFGSWGYVYDPNETPMKQTTQIATYLFEQSFRFWGQIIDQAELGTITHKEKEEQEKVMKESLSYLDRILTGVFGYKYVRANLKERQGIMLKAMKKEHTKRAFLIKKKYSGEKQKRMMASLRGWQKRCMKWIRYEMK